MSRFFMKLVIYESISVYEWLLLINELITFYCIIKYWFLKPLMNADS